jgi:hypothetical protein
MSRRPAGTVRPEDVPGVASGVLAADWTAAAEFAAKWPVRNDRDYASRITEVLLEAGVGDPAVLLAGVLLGAVRDGGCPLSRVRRRFGEQVAVLIARQLPPPKKKARSADPRGTYGTVVPAAWRVVARELPLAAELRLSLTSVPFGT